MNIMQRGKTHPEEFLLFKEVGNIGAGVILALIKQYEALMVTEGLRVEFDPNAIEEIAEIAEKVNETTENIGARRLHTVMEKVMEEISFSAPDMKKKKIKIDKKYVQNQLKDIVKDEDLSRFIL